MSAAPSYLQRGHYVGIEPDRWLLDAALGESSVHWLVRWTEPTFLRRSDFDARELRRTYDYVLAHSILSHCAQHQLEFLGVSRFRLDTIEGTTAGHS